MYVENTGGTGGRRGGCRWYLQDLEASWRTPVRQVVGFQRVALKPGEREADPLHHHSQTDGRHQRQWEFPCWNRGASGGDGGGLPGGRAQHGLGAAAPLTAEFESAAAPRALPY